jgi:glycosyltransferase XagB
MRKKIVSIVIPALNEEGNIKELVKRIDVALKKNGIEYEIIFVDDNSTDRTAFTIRELSAAHPIKLYFKQGLKGKAHSLIEGFKYASGDLIAIIDSDLQYPPEKLPEMIKKIGPDCDIVVANRIVQSTTLLRKILNRGFILFFSKFLHGMDYDVQAGMKVFKKKIADEINFSPNPWTFDLEFLVRARKYGYAIKSADIIFASRRIGESKINLPNAILEIGLSAIILKFKKIPCLAILPQNKNSMIGAGIACDGKRFATHTTIRDGFSARRVLLKWQLFALFIILSFIFLGLMINWITSIKILIALLSALYFFDMLFSFYLISKSLNNSLEIKSEAREIVKLSDDELPIYSILCPLYKEAHMIDGFISAIEKLDWPKNKLDVLLLLEEKDKVTIETVKKMALPEFIRIVIVPYSLPQTKPKACNYGIGFAKGEYLVIYDAEDIPDPLQLKKAYLAFKKVPSDIWCLQAKLNYFNPNDNLLTKFFTAEYSLWFDVILPGLQYINTAIPLGGTSNHFRTKNIIELEGWDPFNVTEDCDLGLRIFRKGYRTAMLDSVTFEEANSDLKNWLRQRSRWIKGYLQTYLVHMRDPIGLFRRDFLHALFFQLIIGGKTAFVFLNPILWIATFSYFAFYGLVGESIERLYPPAIFYMASISLIFGNFIFIYCYMIGCAKRGHWSVIKYVFLMPFYWLLMSIAASIALWQLVIKPHFWEKTNHGLSKQMNTIVKKNKKPIFGDIAIPDRYKIIFKKENVLFISLIVANFVNFIFNAFLGRVLNYEELGLVVFYNTLLYLSMIFIGAFSAVINREVAYMVAKKGVEHSSKFFLSTKKNGLNFAILVSIIWFILTPYLSNAFNIKDYEILLSFAIVIIFGVVSAANTGYLNGNLLFTFTAAVILTESLGKLIMAFMFYNAGMNKLIFLTIPISVVISAILSQILALKKTSKVKAKKNFAFPKKLYMSSILAGVSVMVFLSIDIILVKHYLSPEAAGEYVLLSLAGKMIFFFSSLPGIFMISFISRDIGLGKSPKNSFFWIYGFTLLLASFGYIILGIFGKETMPILFGDKTQSIIPFLEIYTLAIALIALSNTIVTYHLARKNYIFTSASFIFSLAMIIGIVLFHDNIYDIVNVIFWTSAIGWVIIHLMHFQKERVDFAMRGLADFFDMFFTNLPKNRKIDVPGKRILIFNWRDLRHKYSGGAEVYIESMARKWVAAGNQVTLFSGNDGFSPRSEIREGVEILRRGGFYFVYFWGFFYYIFRFRGKYDIIIDCHNGIPFFTPLYCHKRIFCLMHHVHQEVFRESLSKPLALFASFLENKLMPLVYKNIQIITVSESSKQQILDLGLGISGIWVVNPGIDFKNSRIESKSKDPLILYLGRLKQYKSIDVLIKAFKIVAEENLNAILIIAGSGEEDFRLKKLAKGTGLKKGRILFAGNVNEKDKMILLRKSWALVNPSMIEGWSIVVIEASACGTLSIVSDVPGLRDSVKDNETGLLVKYGNEVSLAKNIKLVIDDDLLRKRLSDNARKWAENFDWQKSSDKFFSIINYDIAVKQVGEERISEA